VEPNCRADAVISRVLLAVTVITFQRTSYVVCVPFALQSTYYMEKPAGTEPIDWVKSIPP
jgi:hypothetical protein